MTMTNPNPSRGSSSDLGESKSTLAEAIRTVGTGVTELVSVVLMQQTTLESHYTAADRKRRIAFWTAVVALLVGFTAVGVITTVVMHKLADMSARLDSAITTLSRVQTQGKETQTQVASVASSQVELKEAAAAAPQVEVKPSKSGKPTAVITVRPRPASSSSAAPAPSVEVVVPLGGTVVTSPTATGPTP